ADHRRSQAVRCRAGRPGADRHRIHRAEDAHRSRREVAHAGHYVVVVITQSGGAESRPAITAWCNARKGAHVLQPAERGDTLRANAHLTVAPPSGSALRQPLLERPAFSPGEPDPNASTHSSVTAAL